MDGTMATAQGEGESDCRLRWQSENQWRETLKRSKYTLISGRPFKKQKSTKTGRAISRGAKFSYTDYLETESSLGDGRRIQQDLKHNN